MYKRVCWAFTRIRYRQYAATTWTILARAIGLKDVCHVFVLISFFWLHLHVPGIYNVIGDKHHINHQHLTVGLYSLRLFSSPFPVFHIVSHRVRG